MSLNLISNYAAQVAHRNLTHSDMSATASLAKLSAGSRVLSAKDDAAALAVGTRFALDVTGLKQAAVNAGQASSLLQIADGAMGQVNDILARMKSLAVQAGSGQLSSTDRAALNTEFTTLRSEIGRIAADTEFSGTKLVNGSQSVQTMPAGLLPINSVSSVSAQGFDLGGNTTSAAYSLGYASSTKTFTLNDGTTFWIGSLDASVISSNVTTASTIVKLTAAGSSAEMDLTIDAGFTTNSNVASAVLTLQGNSTTSFTFKVGTGTVAAEDDISISLGSVTLATLGLTSSTITDTTLADTASDAVSSAVDSVNSARATVGALQNRLEFAASNIATATENEEAARSKLMDLDMAAEMSSYVSKNILLQAGVSMLAQANQMPQSLLRLFQ